MIPRLENYKTRPSVDRRIFHETIDRDRSSSKSRLNLDSDMYAFTGINIVTSIYTIIYTCICRKTELNFHLVVIIRAVLSFPPLLRFSFFQIFSLFSLTRAMTSCRFFFDLWCFFFPLSNEFLSSLSSLIILLFVNYSFSSLSPFFSSLYEPINLSFILLSSSLFPFFLKYLLPSLISPRDILPAFLFNSSIYI